MQVVAQTATSGANTGGAGGGGGGFERVIGSPAASYTYTIGAGFGMPLLRIDLGGLKSKYVGESEDNLRRALALADTVSPCVLWFDEIEKALAGSSGPQGDGGVSTDALGTILTWMQERTSRVFVVATANDVRALPPELLRKGRFDDIFFVDLPNRVERAEILRVTLKGYGRSVEGIDTKAVVDATVGFTGAEVAAIVPDAMFRAFADGARPITTADLVEVASTVAPLAETAKEKISDLRTWAKGKTRPASTVEVVKATKANRGGLDMDD
jgi:SpoVK/Ycf46/Vps4 family AAA+-type ATPase